MYILSQIIFKEKPQKTTPWTITFLPRSLREQAKSSKRVQWRPRPPLASTPPFGSFGAARGMRGPQARWLWPRRPRKSKRNRPREASSPTPRHPPFSVAAVGQRREVVIRGEEPQEEAQGGRARVRLPGRQADRGSGDEAPAREYVVGGRRRQGRNLRRGLRRRRGRGERRKARARGERRRR